MNARRGAAALMAAAAAAVPASASAATTGTVARSEARLPMVLPKPNGARVVVDSPAAFAEAVGGRDAQAYANPTDNTVHIVKGGGRDRFAISHEMGHLLDQQLLTDADRQRFARILRAPAGAWDATETTGPRGSAGEWFADYYAAASTGMTGRPERRGGALIQHTMDSYAMIRPRPLRKFRRVMDGIARRGPAG